MTVSYQAELGVVRYGRLFRLLLRWRGSLYKLILFDLALLLFLYYFLILVYYLLNREQQTNFESVVAVCQAQSTLVPVTLIMGFYLTTIVKRWWSQCMLVPWPDPIAVYVSTLIVGKNESGRMVRRTIMRYMILTYILTLRKISPSVGRRFRTYDDIIEKGILTPTEKKMFLFFEKSLPNLKNYWIPIVWSANIVLRARKEGLIRDDNSVQTILYAVNNLRNSCLRLLHFDFVSLPLIYTQAVTLVFYTYFLTAAIAHQAVGPNITAEHTFQKYVPVILIFQFLCLNCLLKIAEVLIAPFGDDDDDFELNWLIDRNIRVSYAIVDEMHQKHPELMKDAYWDSIYPEQLPYRKGVPVEEAPPSSTQKMEEQKSKFHLAVFSKKDDRESMVAPIQQQDLLSEISTDDNRHVEDMSFEHESDFFKHIQDFDDSSDFENLRRERLYLQKTKDKLHYIPVNIPVPGALKRRPIAFRRGVRFLEPSSTSLTSTTTYVTLHDCGSLDDSDNESLNKWI